MKSHDFPMRRLMHRLWTRFQKKDLTFTDGNRFALDLAFELPKTSRLGPQAQVNENHLWVHLLTEIGLVHSPLGDL